MPQQTHEAFDVDAMSQADAYKLLSSLVMPRPIAWVVTQSPQGGRNAAPYSFFKDTLDNIRSTGELVIHMVSEDLAEAMNTTAIDAPRGTDETQLAGLDLVPSLVVAPPRIARAKAALECRLHQEIDLGTGNTILLARVLQAHVARDAFEDRSRLHIDTDKLALIGRMTGGEGGYCRTSDTFSLARPTWKDREDR